MTPPNRNHRLNNDPGNPVSTATGLHIVALFEGVKGLIVLLVGFELLTFIHKDLHAAAVHLVELLHISPASYYSRIFLNVTEHINDTGLWSLAIAAAVYSTLRIIEAVGLWLRKMWAEWVAIISGGIYLPVELFEVFRQLTWPRVIIFLINLAIVVYLVIDLRKKRAGNR